MQFPRSGQKNIPISSLSHTHLRARCMRAAAIAVSVSSLFPEIEEMCQCCHVKREKRNKQGLPQKSVEDRGICFLNFLRPMPKVAQTVKKETLELVRLHVFSIFSSIRASALFQGIRLHRTFTGYETWQQKYAFILGIACDTSVTSKINISHTKCAGFTDLSKCVVANGSA